MSYFTLPKILLIYSFLGIATLSSTVSATETSATRPKIGVALSGGGARGIAHIGVLEALEKLNIPIDYIAGTSMGSIIGGLYASGLSIQDLRRALEEIDWDRIFHLKVERDHLSYREKQNQRRFFQIEIGLDKNYTLTAPSGFVGGQDLFLALKRLTRNINTDDFSKLPIEFKAVAVDFNTAEVYWLEKGDLALALRASMAVPFAFAPVEIDGRLLVDGGILNNLPVDVVKTMGADIVIAVNISTPLTEIKSSSSFLTVASQSLDAALIQNTRRALEEADIIITPNLEGYGFTDFKKGTEMIAKGYEAVTKKADLFKELQINPSQYARERTELTAKAPPVPDSITPAFIKFTGNQRTSTSVLQGKLNDLIGLQLSLEDIEKETTRLMSLNDFEQITYNIEQNKLGQTGLVFNVREKAWGPNYFRLGLNVRTTFNDKAEFIALFRHERLNINRFGAEWITELSVGEEYGLFTEFYQPLDYSRRFFIAPYAGFERIFASVFEQQRGIAEYDLGVSQLGIDLGMNFGNVAELRAGILRNHIDADLRIGDLTRLPARSFEENLLALKFGYDNLDNQIFPRRGARINITGKFYHERIDSDSNYQKMKFALRKVFPINPTLTMMTDANIFTFLHTTPPKYDNFSIGGVNYLAGYPEGDIGGKHALVLQTAWLFNPSNLTKQILPDSDNNIRLAGFLHAGNAWDTYDDINTDLLYGGLAGFAWDTQFGSLFLGAGYTKGGSINYYLSLGNLF
jgi:NTE family protein